MEHPKQATHHLTPVPHTRSQPDRPLARQPRRSVRQSNLHPGGQELSLYFCLALSLYLSRSLSLSLSLSLFLSICLAFSACLCLARSLSLIHRVTWRGGLWSVRSRPPTIGKTVKRVGTPVGETVGKTGGRTVNKTVGKTVKPSPE